MLKILESLQTIHVLKFCTTVPANNSCKDILHYSPCQKIKKAIGSLRTLHLHGVGVRGGVEDASAHGEDGGALRRRPVSGRKPPGPVPGKRRPHVEAEA